MLGYPGSMGGLVDFLVCDGKVAPPTALRAIRHPERLVMLPSFFLVSDHATQDAARPTRTQIDETPPGMGAPSHPVFRKLKAL